MNCLPSTRRALADSMTLTWELGTQEDLALIQGDNCDTAPFGHGHAEKSPSLRALPFFQEKLEILSSI